ncbi:MAG: AAA family ATPase [Bacteroidales bacterium]
MKLSSFRIRNFRSIVDSGWQKLSPDNITCLIGQNESGKTSVLEGLRAFYTGNISEDILRSDLTLPEISCRFTIKEGWLLEVTESPGTEMRELLSGLGEVELTRKWLADFSSVIKVSGVVSEYLDSLENAWKLYLDEVTTKLDSEISEINRLDEQLNETVTRKNTALKKLAADDRSGFGIRLFRKKEEDAVLSGHEKSELKALITDLSAREADLQKLINLKSNVRRAGETYLSLKKTMNGLNSHMHDVSLRLEERHQQMTLLIRPGGENDDTDWKAILEDFRQTRHALDKVAADFESHVAYCGYIMEGLPEEDARRKVSEIIKTYRSQFTSEMLGQRYFTYTPVIDLFEDFSSLLPNRIDMEDIVTGNEMVEGFKAARNFLTIANLDYSFFQQPSSRILKQKIENLNHSLTLNFQDFWQQSIGRNNKIRIQFELDHYSSAFGEKAGKPYLEFWIKDEGERLYPKQRSRGVRWFLSFYLELKAAASVSDKPMVLLVDEPGVSLHARAQEDVLKVFEDIKDRIQIIYTTHSPHLVDINKLHRVLAVQRDDLDSLRSNTSILDPLRLTSATPDTLTPLQSIMGNPLGAEGFSSERLNLIVNDLGSFYMITAVMQITGFKSKISLVPSTDLSSIPLMCNIMMGWGLRFAVVVFDNEAEKAIAGYLKKNMYRSQTGEGDVIVSAPAGMLNAEDLLSTLDFKNQVMGTREGITVQNSVYMREKELPRNFLLSKFLSDVRSGQIKARDLDEETMENFREFIAIIKGLK